MADKIEYDRYIVLKRKDVEKYLTTEEVDALVTMWLKIYAGRQEEGRNPLVGVFYESDWEGYYSVLDRLEQLIKK